MNFSWTAEVSRGLDSPDNESLAALFHENTKLAPELARRAAAEFSMTPFEAFVSSRGFRQYRGRPTVALPEPIDSDETVAGVMRRRRSSRDLGQTLRLDELATLLRQSLGPTALVENGPVSQPLRAWPSAGGLYPIDSYVVAARVEGVEAGLYHFNPFTSMLELLPARTPREILRDGFFWQDFVTEAAGAVLLVGVFERTMAKYGERGYRLVLLDAGHAAQNLLLTAEQLRLNAVAIAGFCDDALAHDLGIDGVDETVLHAVAVGGST
ncbi:MAG: SagB/ThcOx family dehydrogenase [Actinomycetota bacterium]|nr:SagB/ThcOx family dehydrogenase [Actinomycetota bacterium]